MINTLEELIQDYARYSFMEGTIDENTSMHLIEDAQNYIKELGKENLLNIPVVSVPFVCDKCQSKECKELTRSTSQCKQCNHLKAN